MQPKDVEYYEKQIDELEKGMVETERAYRYQMKLANIWKARYQELADTVVGQHKGAA